MYCRQHSLIYIMVVKKSKYFLSPSTSVFTVLHRRAAHTTNSKGAQPVYISEITQKAVYNVRCLWGNLHKSVRPSHQWPTWVKLQYSSAILDRNWAWLKNKNKSLTRFFARSLADFHSMFSCTNRKSPPPTHLTTFGIRQNRKKIF
jgi:hypothetical protein